MTRPDPAGGSAGAGGAGTRPVRLFVALDLPRPVRSVLAQWAAERRRGLTGLRLIAERNLHVTLCFLGWRDEAEVEEIRGICRSVTETVTAGRGPVRLSVSAALWLPPRRPRVLAVELTDTEGRLASVQSALARALAAGGFYEPEDRPFLAHVTVARVQRGVRIRPEPLSAPDVPAVTAAAVTLYRSRLKRSGAEYEALDSIPVGAPSSG